MWTCLLIENVSEEANCGGESMNESEGESEQESVEATKKERRTNDWECLLRKVLQNNRKMANEGFYTWTTREEGMHAREHSTK